MRADNTIRDALADFLGMLAHKARTGQMTDDDVAVLSRAIHDAGGIRATVRDMAGYYGQSEDNIRHIIHRNLLPKPERRVYFDFGAFRRRAGTEGSHSVYRVPQARGRGLHPIPLGGRNERRAPPVLHPDRRGKGKAV